MGARGGWELAADPAAVTLAQVWRLLQGEDPVLGVHGPNPSCAVGSNVQHVLADLDRRVADAIVAELERLSLDDVLTGAGFDAATYAALAAAPTAL